MGFQGKRGEVSRDITMLLLITLNRRCIPPDPLPPILLPVSNIPFLHPTYHSKSNRKISQAKHPRLNTYKNLIFAMDCFRNINNIHGQDLIFHFPIQDQDLCLFKWPKPGSTKTRLLSNDQDQEGSKTWLLSNGQDQEASSTGSGPVLHQDLVPGSSTKQEWTMTHWEPRLFTRRF